MEEIFSASGEEDRDGLVSSDRESRATKLSNEGEEDWLQVLEEWDFLGWKYSGYSFLGFEWQILSWKSTNLCCFRCFINTIQALRVIEACLNSPKLETFPFPTYDVHN